MSNFDKIGLDDRNPVQKKWSTLHKGIVESKIFFVYFFKADGPNMYDGAE